ncbi:HNH endonuclease [Microbacterium sp. cx-55]|uniref:HNH endonuclease signature motif containing protein n=1 Tax=Microbacterium sp. cx-55 TaxID=2875948 RepID=UPI001CBE4BEA|nr:HNH endonuclease signature motif containing protein [Microbacterium sp. cx-55]MBZ4488246.1 HNH endonuclease [Microbacterium sp. cx-55]UGB34906.1 HNH endonuclease [Microbacterium sp. cx-55]
MNGTIRIIRDLESRLGAVASEVFAEGALRSATDDDVLAVMDAAAAVIRRAEALVTEAAGEVQARSASSARAERMTTRYGCRHTRELIQRVTRTSGRTSGDYARAGAATATRRALTGDTLPAPYPALRAAVAAGAIGVDAVTAVSATLDAADISAEQRAAAETELAASARGEGADENGLPTADDLRLQAQVWAMYLDPDGAEPRADAAERHRGLVLGACRDGRVPIRGELLPEVAAPLTRLDHAINNPRARVTFRDNTELESEPESEEDAPVDSRTRPQKLHDAFATALNVAARSSEVPTIGGAAPTLLVSVRHEDLASGHGVAHLDGIDEPVPLSVARRIACSGSVQHVVFDRAGRIARIEIPDRVFDHHQRRAITLRDGGCIIPGCDVPAAWCEIHHVHEAATGGPTSTDNGVLLCWHHHRTLDSGGWSVRMRRGVPEVRGPGWWDPGGTWRRVAKSPTRTLDRYIAART